MDSVSSEGLAMASLQDRRETCDRANCTREVNGSYKGHSLCNQHLGQFVVMQSR